MATPRSIMVVHASLSKAFDKTFPRISSSGTHNQQGMPSRPRISKGTFGLFRPVNSMKNIAHNLIAPLTLNLPIHLLVRSQPSRCLILFLYLPCPISLSTLLPYLRDIRRCPASGVCSRPFTSWPRSLPPELPNMSFRNIPHVLLLHQDAPGHILHPSHLFMCIACPHVIPSHNPQG